DGPALAEQDTAAADVSRNDVAIPRRRASNRDTDAAYLDSGHPISPRLRSAQVGADVVARKHLGAAHLGIAEHNAAADDAIDYDPPDSRVGREDLQARSIGASLRAAELDDRLALEPRLRGAVDGNGLIDERQRAQAAVADQDGVGARADLERD